MKLIFAALLVTALIAIESPASRATNPLNSPEAMKALRERAAAGDLAAMSELGYVLQNDTDQTNDIEGRDLLIESANRGYWGSAVALGNHYLYGWSDWARVNDEANTTEAIRWLRQAGETAPPDVDASEVYRMLGRLYSHTFMRQIDFTAAPLDEPEAIKWFRLCAAAGDEYCAGDLGRVLVKRPETGKEGVQWLLSAAERGNGWSMRDLGDLYAEGRVVRRDPVAALTWYQNAATWTPQVSEGNDLVWSARGKGAEIEKDMTPEEIRRAHDISAQFKPTKP